MRGQLRLAFGLIVALVVMTAPVARAQAQKTPKSYEKLIYSVKGPDLFRAHCAACHGLGAKGDGPVAATLKIKPANLTLLAKHYNGKFPEAYVAEVIQSGPRDAKAHGSKDMPVWGTLFSATDDPATVKQRIYNLTKYIETLQAN